MGRGEGGASPSLPARYSSRSTSADSRHFENFPSPSRARSARNVAPPALRKKLSVTTPRLHLIEGPQP